MTNVIKNNSLNYMLNNRRKNNRVAILLMCLSYFGILFGVFGVGLFFFFLNELLCNSHVTLIQGHGNRCG